MRSLALVLVPWVFLGCIDDKLEYGEQEAAVTACPKEQVAFAEMGEFAIKSQSDFAIPAGLADAITSLHAACQRNPNQPPNSCRCLSGAAKTAKADKAAWNNILNSLKGSDRSNEAAYFCVGTQGCSIVSRCKALPGNGFAEWVDRQYPLPIVAETRIDTKNLRDGRVGSIYYYRDSGDWNCQILKSTEICGSIEPGTASNGFTAKCNKHSQTFLRGETVWALVRFTELWKDHRFKVEFYRNNALQGKPYETEWNRIGREGWRQAYFWPSLANGLPGTWEFRIFIDYGTGYRRATSATFTIR